MIYTVCIQIQMDIYRNGAGRRPPSPPEVFSLRVISHGGDHEGIARSLALEVDYSIVDKLTAKCSQPIWKNQDFIRFT